jgi:hypothetical protein
MDDQPVGTTAMYEKALIHLRVRHTRPFLLISLSIQNREESFKKSLLILYVNF